MGMYRLWTSQRGLNERLNAVVNSIIFQEYQPSVWGGKTILSSFHDQLLQIKLCSFKILTVT